MRVNRWPNLLKQVQDKYLVILLLCFISLIFLNDAAFSKDRKGLNQSDLFDALDISASGILAQRWQLELIASNLANINSTRTSDGRPYRRQIAIFSAQNDSFNQPKGVKVEKVIDDPTPFKKVYNPTHPDADAGGFIYLPNVDLSYEMINLILTTRIFEANITVFNAAKHLANTTLELVR